jgi:hypothetical protein
VVQRHRVDPHVPWHRAERARKKTAVVDKAAVAEHGPFWKAGCARRVLDLCDVIRRHRRQAAPHRARTSSLSGGEKRRPFGKRQDLAKDGQVRPDLTHDCRQVAAADHWCDKDADRFRLSQHVRQFGGLERRVDRDQRQAGERRAELEQDPLRAVG